MTNLVNRLLVKEYGDALGAAKGIVVLGVTGMTVPHSELLRDKLAEKGVKMRLVRNSLAHRVLAERGFELAPTVFAGNVALAWGSAEAAIHTAKIVTSPEIKKTGKITLRAGVLDGELLDARDTAALASVPDQNTLRAQLVGLIQGPARSLVSLLAANPSGLARVIRGRADQAGPADEATPQS